MKVGFIGLVHMGAGMAHRHLDPARPRFGTSQPSVDHCDRTGWLGRRESNLCILESNPV
jgi:hypothetical protein